MNEIRPRRVRLDKRKRKPSEARRAAARRYAKQNPDVKRRLQNASYRRRREQDPEGMRKLARQAKLKRKYGLTLEQEALMVQQQEGRCAVCQQPPREGWRLHVDHDHQTGKVRELLCDGCNRALGCVQERPEVLLALVAYLEKHREVVDV